MIIQSTNTGLYEYNGNYITKIGQRGKGPGEYISRAGVLYIDSIIRILDRTQHKVIDYNLNGDFIDEYHIEDMFGQSFVHWNGFNFVYIGNELNPYNKRLFVYDNSFTMLDSFFSLDDSYDYMNRFDKTNFFIHKDSLRFMNSFEYNIYNVSVSGNSFEVKPRYYVDFGKHEIPESFLEQPFNDIREYDMALEETNYAHSIQGYIENEDNIMFNFKFKDSWYLAIYSKHNDETIVIDKIKDDVLFDGLTFYPIDEYFSYYFYDNKVYYPMFPYELNDNIEKLKEQLTADEWEIYCEKNPEIMELYRNTDEADNPIIFVFELQKIG